MSDTGATTAPTHQESGVAPDAARGLTITAVTADDLSDVAALAARTFALACPPGTAQASIDRFIAEQLSPARFDAYAADPQRRLLVARRDGDAVGYAMLVLGAPDEIAAQLARTPTVELSKLYVDASHHGGGIAAPLMAAAVATARDEGARGVWLGTNEANGRAIRFYEKCGFRIVGTKTFDVGGELHHDVVLERVLA
jgi:diamine N-acetyltransferase